MNRIDVLREAGLSRAMAEAKGNFCKNLHAGYLKNNGWSFCPKCGAKLEIIRTCPTCGKTFLSHKAFKYHVIQEQTEECLICRADGKRRPILTIVSFNSETRTLLLECKGCGLFYEKSRIYGLKRLDEEAYKKLWKENGEFAGDEE